MSIEHPDEKKSNGTIDLEIISRRCPYYNPLAKKLRPWQEWAQMDCMLKKSLFRISKHYWAINSTWRITLKEHYGEPGHNCYSMIYDNLSYADIEYVWKHKDLMSYYMQAFTQDGTAICSSGTLEYKRVFSIVCGSQTTKQKEGTKLV
jgi:hypothetical protein